MKHEHVVNNLAGCQTSKELYQKFAYMAVDWVWQLDANLCYVFHDGAENSATGIRGFELYGRNRLDVFNDHFTPNEQLLEHNRLLSEHKSLELVLPISVECSTKHMLIIAEPQFDHDGEFTGYLGCGRDVTQRVELVAKLEHFATHDDLTGICNRREFQKQLQEIHDKSKTESQGYTLCFVDLDRFKHVNDTGGHHAGDQLLRELVRIISGYLQHHETLARLGGDEFGLLLHSDVEQAKQQVEKIIDEVSRYVFKWENHQFQVGASIGLTPIDATSRTIDELMVKADNGCYAAKRNGRNQSHITYSAVVTDSQGVHRVAMIKNAIMNNQYKLLMQPIVNLSDKQDQDRYELLVRLSCDNGELLEPAEFMALAKKYSLMQELDCWVIENALMAQRSFQQSGDNVGMSINLSASTLTTDSALTRIVELFDEYQVPLNAICFDITGSHAIRNKEMVVRFMDTMRAKGAEFALDDFGNGLCSFSYLQQFTLDYLKIDGEIIRNISTDQTSMYIAQSIHELSARLGIKTVAESVEDDATIDILKSIGMNYMQGFGVSGLVELQTKTDVAYDRSGPN